MITKHTGTATDTRGTEFTYTCYTTVWERDFEDVKETIYVCNEFPKVEAKTLKGLKEKMGNL